MNPSETLQISVCLKSLLLKMLLAWSLITKLKVSFPITFCYSYVVSGKGSRVVRVPSLAEVAVVEWGCRATQTIQEDDVVANYDLLREYMFLFGGKSPLPDLCHHEVNARIIPKSEMIQGEQNWFKYVSFFPFDLLTRPPSYYCRWSTTCTPHFMGEKVQKALFGQLISILEECIYIVEQNKTT